MAEWRARMFLRMHGFRIIQSRYVTGRGTGRAEIDIIARRGRLMIFVEVKCHKTFESAWASINPRQAARLRAAAETFLMRRQWHGDARFDVIIVNGMRMHWIKNSI